MTKERLYQDVPNLVLKHYNMTVDTRVQDKSIGIGKVIYTWIIFRPKKINTLTPKPVNFYSKYIYTTPNNTDNLSYEDALYIRKDDMPLLKYISGEYYLDEFCEKLARKIAEETVEKIKSGEEVKKLSMKVRVYLDYFMNDF